jgi:hypothetical protein
VRVREFHQGLFARWSRCALCGVFSSCGWSSLSSSFFSEQPNRRLRGAPTEKPRKIYEKPRKKRRRLGSNRERPWKVGASESPPILYWLLYSTHNNYCRSRLGSLISSVLVFCTCACKARPTSLQETPGWHNWHLFLTLLFVFANVSSNRKYADCRSGACQQ